MSEAAKLYRYMIKRLISLIFFVALTAAAAMGQTFDSSTDISKLTDAQIQKISTEMKKNGYTMTQVEAMGKSRGMTDKQLSDLKTRLEEYEKKASEAKKTAATTTSSLEALMTDAEQDEKSVFEITEKDKMIFGFSLFNNSELTFEPNLNIPVPDGYILGPGDEVMIDIWGQSEMSYDLIVSSNGSIEIPELGPVNVSGVSFKDAKSRIETRLRSIYSDLGGRTSVSITTGQLRTINVNVMGEVYLPGTYTVSGAATLFNVLYLSGGPNTNGSFRNVQLIRNGKVVAKLDVYDFLLKGNASVNVPLYNNDIVMIPTYQKRVAVGGAFKRTGYFEAIEGETVKDIIDYAGGFQPNALTDHVNLTRVGKYGMEFLDVNETTATSVTINSGDSVSVAAVDPERLYNAVTITGGVMAQGAYGYKPGMKLSDLLRLSGGLVENAFLNRGVITRMKDDYTLESLNFNVADLAAGRCDVELKDRDDVLIATIDDLRQAPNISIKGSVNKPGTFPYRDNITVGDLILLAGGLTVDASILNVEIVHRLTDEVADTSVYTLADHQLVNITRDLNLQDEGNSVKLEPYDVVTIRNHPSAGAKGTVRITGEVLFAGTYELLTKNDNIKSIIERAGGLTPNAYLAGAKLYRIYSQTARERLLRQAIAQKLDTLNWDSKTMNFESVSIDFNALMNGGEDLILQDGDEIEIPCKSETMVIAGQVLNPISLLWTGDVSARKCIKMAGGFTPQADKKRTYVIYADGHAETVRHILFFRRYPKMKPGCYVNVPEKPFKEGMTITQTVSLSSSILTLALIVISLF